jgi:branched-chain amino acid transport system permease protein
MSRRQGRWIVYLAGFLLYAALVFLIETRLKGFYRYAMQLFAINAIVALGANVTNGYTNIFSLGFGGIMLVAAYVSSLLTLPPEYKEAVLELPRWLEQMQLPLLPALLVAGVVAVLASIVLVLPAFRLRGHYFILASIGINIVMLNLGVNLRTFTHGPLGLRNIPFYANSWWVYGILLLTVLFVSRFIHSKFGRALVAISKDQTLAGVLSVNVVRYKIYSFVIGSFIVGIGGALWVHLIGAMHPHVFDLLFVFYIIAMLAIGGIGTISGSILGAAVITLFRLLGQPIQEGFSVFGLEIPPLIGLLQVLTAVLLVIVLRYRPQGIMNGKELTIGRISHAVRTALSRAGLSGRRQP